MKVAITGGGTAGHVTPLLAIASELKEHHPDYEIVYIGQYKDPMKSIIDKDVSVTKSYSILAGKFRRYHGVGFISHLADITTNLKNVRDFIFFVIGFFQSLFILLFDRPDLLFVKGGFVGLPVGLAANWLKIPIVTHDSDSIPGLTNKILSKHAKLQAVGMPKEFYKGLYDMHRLRYTGVPIRKEFLLYYPKLEARKKYKLLPSDKVVAVIGGSLGAIRLNEYLFKNLDELLKNGVKILWVAGDNSIKHYAKLIENKENVQIFGFSNDLPAILNSADIVISRAGATSIAELAVMQQPTILVPNPILAGGHQTKNAVNLAKNQAVVVLTEDELNNDYSLLSNTINELFKNSKKLKELSSNIKKLAVEDSSQRIVNVIEEALNAV